MTFTYSDDKAKDHERILEETRRLLGSGAIRSDEGVGHTDIFEELNMNNMNTLEPSLVVDAVDTSTIHEETERLLEETCHSDTIEETSMNNLNTLEPSLEPSLVVDAVDTSAIHEETERLLKETCHTDTIAETSMNNMDTIEPSVVIDAVDTSAIHEETERLLKETCRIVPILEAKTEVIKKSGSSLAKKLRNRSGNSDRYRSSNRFGILRPVLTSDLKEILPLSKSPSTGLKVLPPTTKYGNESIVARKRMLSSLQNEALRKKTEEKQAERDRFHALKNFDEEEGGFSDNDEGEPNDEGKPKNEEKGNDEDVEEEYSEEEYSGDEPETGWAASLASRLGRQVDEEGVEEEEELDEGLPKQELEKKEEYKPAIAKKLFETIEASKDVYAEEEEDDFSVHDDEVTVSQSQGNSPVPMKSPEPLQLQLTREMSFSVDAPAPIPSPAPQAAAEEAPEQAESEEKPKEKLTIDYPTEQSSNSTARQGRFVALEAEEEDVEGNIVLKSDDKEEERVLMHIEREELIHQQEMLAKDDDPEVGGDINHDFNREWNEAEDRIQTRKIVKNLVQGGWKNRYENNSDSDGPLQRRKLARQNRMFFGRKKKQMPELSFSQKVADGDVVPLVAEAFSDDDDAMSPKAFKMSMRLPIVNDDHGAGNNAEIEDVFGEIDNTPIEVTDAVSRTLVEASSQPISISKDVEGSMSFYRPASRMGTGAFKSKSKDPKPTSGRMSGSKRRRAFFSSISNSISYTHNQKEKENNTEQSSSKTETASKPKRKFRRTVSKLSVALAVAGQ